MAPVGKEDGERAAEGLGKDGEDIGERHGKERRTSGTVKGRAVRHSTQFTKRQSIHFEHLRSTPFK